MKAFIDRLRAPATDSHLGLALGLSMILMALLLCAVLWQSSIIVNQRDVIRWLWINGAQGFRNRG